MTIKRHFKHAKGGFLSKNSNSKKSFPRGCVDRGAGEGVKNWQNLAYVVYGCPQIELKMRKEFDLYFPCMCMHNKMKLKCVNE